ncbi:MAG TPA: phage major capsid protein [Verrucomicrobiae bacterium]|nr:phage major capsid protein [Verrucomicrobiae bacterium]
MKSFIRTFPHLIALAAVCLLAIVMVMLGAPFAVAIVFIGLWQLSQMAMSKRPWARCHVSALTPEQIEEFEEILKGMKQYSGMMGELKLSWPTIKGLAERCVTLERGNDDLRREIGRMKKNGVAGTRSGVTWIGDLPFVTDDCANALTATLIYGCSKIEGKLESVIPDESKRKRILTHSLSILGIEQRAGGALTSTDVPLPTIYMPQIVELVFAYGQARQFATVFPLGAGTVKLPKLQPGEDTFGFLGAGTAGMSQNVPQKEVEAALVTFTANKCGGLIRVPTELEEDTFIALGQFLARYIARQFAKLEDSTLFLADGTGTYAGIIGIGNYCVANPAYLQQLGAGKTVVTDATVNDFRAMRGKVNPAVLFNMAANGKTSAAYYMSPTMEALLWSFNAIGMPYIYRPEMGGQPATLDGFPIRWIGVSQPYSTAATPGAFMAFFGDLSYWYLGERGSPRVEVSREVFFQTDELAMRALERIDVEAMAPDAMTTLQTAAA